MGSTAVVLPHACNEHAPGPAHPERTERLCTIHHRLHRNTIGSMVDWLDPSPVDMEWVEKVHDVGYIDRFRAACERGSAFIDTTDCPICPASFKAARIAAGAAVTGVDAVMRGHDHAFVAVRPPGHHAERDHAMGFCFFNNIAIAAEYARARHGLSRIAILDWDVHHGNGTQHRFETDPDVFFCSIHEHPATLYPGTGYESERGVGDGEGATLNLAMPAGSRDEDYRRAFEQRVLPAIDAFRPQLLLLSSGFDAHHADPLAHIELSTDMFGWMTQRVLELARAHCGGRLVSILEGGYNLSALADSVEAHVEELMHA